MIEYFVNGTFKSAWNEAVGSSLTSDYEYSPQFEWNQGKLRQISG